MKKAIFLDRDGTINKDKKYLYRIEDFEILAGAIDGLRILQNAGYLLIVITNQSGIARGYYTERDYNILNEWMKEMLAKKGIQIAAVYCCPHLPDAFLPMYRKVCDCRKPRLGLYERAVKEFHVDLAQSYAIGDRIRDCAICEKTECRGFLIGTTEEAQVIENVKKKKYRNIQYAKDLYSCAIKICT